MVRLTGGIILKEGLLFGALFFLKGASMVTYLPEMIMLITVAVVLSVAAIYDIIGGQIPLMLFPVFLGFFMALSIVVRSFDPLDSLLGMAIGAVAFVLLAWLYDGGGGDIIMMSGLGWCLGAVRFVYVTLAASVFYFLFFLCVLLYYAVRKRAKEALKKQYPYAPFVLAGYMACLCAGLLL